MAKKDELPGEVIVPAQTETRIFVNGRDEIAILQIETDPHEDDPCVSIPFAFARQVAAKILQLVDEFEEDTQTRAPAAGREPAANVLSIRRGPADQQ